MSNMTLFFDTETTGKWIKKLPFNHDEQPHLVQLAAVLADEEQRVLRATSVIVKPPIPIPQEASDVHGISDELAEEVGVHLAWAMGQFASMVDCASLLVAHNADFDLNVMTRALDLGPWKGAINLLNSKPVYDTMLKSTDLCKLPGQFGKYKWPTLQELHKFLFDAGFEGAHDALEDVRAMMRCYFKMTSEDETDG